MPLVDCSGLMKQFAKIKAGVTSLSFKKISGTEWNHARLHPDCIVDGYLFADVAIKIAPGGVGKTTLILYESIHIILGCPLYGRTVNKPGPVVIVTAEDSREQLVARLSRIAISMNLSPEQIEFVKNNLFIEYVGGEDFRLCNVVGDVVTNSTNVDKFIDAIKPLNPSLVIFDPAVSFGVGESRVNDAEQGLIQAARRFRDAVGCCVRLVHHSGKQNARDGAVDQYAGRGGSAMADGARMVSVLKRLDAKEWHSATGEPLTDGADGLLLAIPKMSYAPAQPHIYIERIGFHYRHIEPKALNPEDKRAAIDDRVVEFLRSEELQSRFHSKSSLEQSETLGITRNETRAVIARLEMVGRVAFTIMPGRGQGQRIWVTDYSPPVTAGNSQFTVQGGVNNSLLANAYYSPPSIEK